ncbi:hypothetical protein Dimus_034261 [Dionaea muscipula]
MVLTLNSCPAPDSESRSFVCGKNPYGCSSNGGRELYGTRPKSESVHTQTSSSSYSSPLILGISKLGFDHSTMAAAIEAPSNKIYPDVLLKARQACYEARDSFYACLESSNKKATEIASVGLLYPVDCKKSRVEFEKSCRSSWVKHFDRQYCAKKRVTRLLEDGESRRGPLSLPQTDPFKPRV